MLPDPVAFQLGDDDITIRPVASDADLRACAEIMSTTQPWITFGRTFESSLTTISAPGAEVYVAVSSGEVAGFMILVLQGAFVGYIRTLALRPAWRGRGLGTRLIAAAEERIFKEHPNVFICVSSFNPRAKALYTRVGYEVVGELRDFVTAGHSEWLLRKTIAPLVAWPPSPKQ